MKDKAIKAVVFGVILLVLFVPQIQEKFEFRIEPEPLQGHYVPALDTVLSDSLWFSGRYVEIKEKWLRENFGLRNFYVRLSNQIDWSLFRKPRTKMVVRGYDDYMFEEPYIKAYFGKDFVGADSLNRITYKLKKLQDTLRKANKLIIPVFASSKATYYPEMIPDMYKSTPGVSNYIYLREKMKHERVYFIDFNSYFLSRKHKSAVPLYPQYGIHWSTYAASLACDSLIRYSEQKLKLDLPELRLQKIEMSDSLRFNDFDLGGALNLLYKCKTFAMGYPEYSVIFDSTRHKKLNLLVVGDSFWYQVLNTRLPRTVFNERFWYYNALMYPEAFSRLTYTHEMDVDKYIKEADIIIIIHSEATMNGFGCGFVHSCFRSFFPNQKISW